MKFMTMVSSDETMGPPPPALMNAIMALGADAMKAGVLVEQGGLMRTAAGGRIRVTKGTLTFTDGPFAESKEVIGGYAVYSVKSKDEVLEWARRFMQIHIDHWPGWEGVSEVRQIFDPADFAPNC
ncbi:MAG: YciI family protein [Gemmatimonadota bacterium]|nr:YciI family protein [Gemmatimonadota bacterium]